MTPNCASDDNGEHLNRKGKGYLVDDLSSCSDDPPDEEETIQNPSADVLDKHKVKQTRFRTRPNPTTLLQIRDSLEGKNNTNEKTILKFFMF